MVGTRNGIGGRLFGIVLAVALLVAAGCAFVGRESASDGAGAPSVSQQQAGFGNSPDGEAALKYSTAARTDRMAGGTPHDVTAEVAGSASDSGRTSSQGDRLVIRNKSMRLEVKAVPSAIKRLRQIAKKHDGIVTDLQVATDDDQPIFRPLTEAEATKGGSQRALSGYVTIRVPAKSFEAFVADADRLGKLLSESENTDDVTEQHVDLKARLKNAQAEEARLREFFDAAKKVSEMLAIERELERVRGEIESMQAQIDYLERQAAMSTIVVELVEPKPVVRPEGTDWGFARSLTAAIRAFVATVNSFIVLLGYLAAIAIPVAMVLIPLRVWMRRRRPTPPEPDEEEQAAA